MAGQGGGEGNQDLSNTEELMLLNCGVGEDLRDCKEIKPVNPKGVSPEYSLEGLMLKLKLNTSAT